MQCTLFHKLKFDIEHGDGKSGRGYARIIEGKCFYYKSTLDINSEIQRIDGKIWLL